MILYSAIKHKHIPKIETPGFFQTLLIWAVKTFIGKSLIGLKLEFYSRFIGFLKAISIHLLIKEQLFERLKTGIDLQVFFLKGDGRIMQSFYELLINYKLIYKKNNKLFLSKQLIKVDPQCFIDFSNKEKQYNFLHDYGFITSLIKDYQKVRENELGQKPDPWVSLMKNGQLDYEIRLCETLINLQYIHLDKKYHPTFDDSYYTGSGENAFRNLTQKHFEKSVDYIYNVDKPTLVLDIGCGYGEHIQNLTEKYPELEITGIEMQPNVFEKTNERFKGKKQVNLLNKNIFDINFDSQRFDLILLNYILFYFSPDDKITLFNKLSEIISENASVLVCQYYPGLENLKTELAKKQKDYSMAKSIEMYYSNKILYANTLWNEVVNTFSLAEKWDEFEKIINMCGFEIVALTNAEKFYYSLFVQIKKSRD